MHFRRLGGGVHHSDHWDSEGQAEIPSSKLRAQITELSSVTMGLPTLAGPVGGDPMTAQHLIQEFIRVLNTLCSTVLHIITHLGLE